MDLATINAQIASAVSPTGAAAKSTAAIAGPGSNFAASLDSALKSVSQAQAQADELQRQFQMENPNVGLEDAVIAMSKANLSFTAAVQVRNRLVQAYDQIMNMPV